MLPIFPQEMWEKILEKMDFNTLRSFDVVTLNIWDPVQMMIRLVLDEKMGLGESFKDGAGSATPRPQDLINVLIRAKKHYDLGNEMFKLFLDPTMTYSSAIFDDVETPGDTVDMPKLETAQLKKIDALIDMMKLTDKDHVLEIGCGWGACAIRATQRTGCKWTGITISHEQLALGLQRVQDAGLQDKITLKYEDYRNRQFYCINSCVLGSPHPQLASVAAMSDTRAFVPSFFHQLISNLICIPFLHKFLSTYLSKSTEVLNVRFPNHGQNFLFGDKNANNNGGKDVVTLNIWDPVQMMIRLVLDEKMGLGESFMDGAWSATPRPQDLLNVLIRAKKQSYQKRGDRKQPSLFSQLVGFLTSWTLHFIRFAAATYNYIAHRLRDNTILNSKKNIEEHYDLGNEMFKLFLDPTMTYSSAIFDDVETPGDTVDMPKLETAQLKKIDALIDMMKLTDKDHVLEIGCGWGACAIRATQRTGCKWTGITISHEQLALGLQRVQDAGLQDKITLKYEDYRLTKGEFSHVISVEMIEAVGEQFLPEYFQVISDRLQSGGRAAIQAIIFPDFNYEKYNKQSDFIKKYIFPGSHIPSVAVIRKCLPKNLTYGEQRNIGKHYAKTLDMWFAAWMEKETELKALGVSDCFHRKWQFYFALCSALFYNDHIDVIQFALDKA